MDTRALGQQGLTGSAQGLGCMGMSAFYGAFDDAESAVTLERALELGVSFWDTADAYGPFTNERLLSGLLARHRDEVVVATKFGNEIGPDGARTGDVNGRPEYVRSSVEGSLQRLGVDTIDLYYQHRVDPDTPVEETFGALGELVQQGKLRFLGISEASPDSIRRAHATAPLSAVQTEWSLFTRDVEDDGVLATVRELGIGFVPYSPLGRGSCPGRSGRSRTSSRTTSGAPARASRARTSPRTSSCSTGWCSSPTTKASPRANSRSPGCSPKARMSCPSLAPDGPRTSRRTSRRSMSCSASRTWQRSSRSRRGALRRASVTPRQAWRRSTADGWGRPPGLCPPCRASARPVAALWSTASRRWVTSSHSKLTGSDWGSRPATCAHARLSAADARPKPAQRPTPAFARARRSPGARGAASTPRWPPA